MAGPIYIANFDFRGRCPENEKGVAGEYAVRLGQFQDRPGGGSQAVESNTMTPAQAEKAGWTLDDILGFVAAQAIRDKEASDAVRDEAVAKRIEVQEQASAALKAAQDAITAAEQAQARAENIATATTLDLNRMTAQHAAAVEALKNLQAERDQIAAAALQTVNALRAELSTTKDALQAAVDAAEPAV